MSIEKQIPSLSKLYLLYEEVPEKFLDQTDVDSYFYHYILDIALIEKRIVRVSKGSNKIIFAFQLFQFCNLKNQQQFILEEEVSVSFKNLQLFWTSYAKFWNKMIKLSSFQLYTLCPNQSKRWVLLYLKTNSLHIISKTLKNIATDKYVSLFVLSVTWSVVSLSEGFKLLVSKTF